MGLDDAIASARSLVAARFPDARAAWLAGSVVTGTATATSDLDVTVLLDGPPAPYRESLEHDGWPVELFVHSRESIDRWIGKDLDRRRPTLVRMISTGVVLVDRDGSAAAVAASCADILERGPGPLADADREWRRYALTDLLDDLADAADPELRSAVAVATWQHAAELLLAGADRWLGTSKWLVRELRGYDEAQGTAYASRLHEALVAAIEGDVAPLTALADEVLDAHGGRNWAGYRASG